MPLQDALAVRLALMRGDYAPIPCEGKRPVLKAWEKHSATNFDEITLWSKLYARAENTGILTRLNPAFDADILNEDAARAIEDLVREHYEDRGCVLVRIGKPPKRAFLFRTKEPFKRIVINFAARDGGAAEKLEFLGDGQQVIVHGAHPDTGKPYHWHGGEPGPVTRDDLPYIREAEARELIERTAALLVAEFGYVRAAERPRQKKRNGAGVTPDDIKTPRQGAEDWQYLCDRIRAGEALHDSLRDLAAKLIATGMKSGAAVNFLRAQMESSGAPRDIRWSLRVAEIPGLVDSAEQYRAQHDKPHQLDNDPVDLWGNFEPPTLPMGLLPKLIEEYAIEQAATMGADPGGVAMATLAVCAAAIPDRIQLSMQQYAPGWRESARLWVTLVGMPSTKKSPIIGAAVWPLAKLDAELVRKYLFELRLWEQLETEERKVEPKPIQKRLRLDDTTIEAAQEALAGSPNGLLVTQDELSGFFGAMDKYGGHRGAAKDRSFWLRSYDGGPYSVSRIVRGVGLVPNLSVCVLGGIQPDVIRKLAAESQDDGFLQRMLIVVLRPAGIGLDVPRSSVVGKYAKLVQQLTELKLPVSGNWNDDHDDLRLDSRAQEIRRKLEAEHHALYCVETINPKLSAHIAKADGVFGRLAVTFHCIEHIDDSYLPAVVTGDTAERVAKLMRQFLQPHALAFYGGILGLSNDHDRLANVAGYILAHKIERLTNRDVQASCRTMRKLEARDTRAVFEQLEALGWLSQTDGPRPSSPPQWLVNPRVHEKFTEQAKTETERRTKVHAVISGLAGRKAGQ